MCTCIRVVLSDESLHFNPEKVSLPWPTLKVSGVQLHPQSIRSIRVFEAIVGIFIVQSVGLHIYSKCALKYKI